MSQLDALWRRGKDFLGTEMPIIAGAMTWISDAPFVAAVSNAGAFGCLAGGNMEPAALADEIRRTRDLTERPFAVNLITIAPNYKAHLDVVVKSRVPFVVFAGSFPTEPWSGSGGAAPVARRLQRVHDVPPRRGGDGTV